MKITLKIKKLAEDAEVPFYAHDGDAGLDLYAIQDVTVVPGARVMVPTGIAMAIPKGYVGLVWDKSGLSMRNGLKTLGGVIDSGYRGEIMVGIANISNEEYTIEKGHKVAQLLIQKVEHAEIEEVAELDNTVRGEGGFGSTGK